MLLGHPNYRVAGHGRTVVMVLHDLNQACRYADHLVALRAGRLHAAGAPGEVVDSAFVRDVFGLAARVVPDPVTGTPLCLPEGSRRPAAGPTQITRGDTCPLPIA